MFEQRQFGGHFVLCQLDGQIPKIQLGNRAYRIQHTQIMLKSAVTNFYSKMHLTCTFLRNSSSLMGQKLQIFLTHYTQCPLDGISPRCCARTGNDEIVQWHIQHMQVWQSDERTDWQNDSMYIPHFVIVLRGKTRSSSTQKCEWDEWLARLRQWSGRRRRVFMAAEIYYLPHSYSI